MSIQAPSAHDGIWHRIPWGLVVVTLLVPLVGIITIASAARVTQPTLYLKQMLWLLAGVVVAAVVARIRPQTFELIAYPFYGVVCLLLVLVLVIGTPIKGAQRWLDLGFFNMQPSELAKFAIILAVARYFGNDAHTGSYTLLELLRPMNATRPLGLLGAVVVRTVTQHSAYDKAVAAAARDSSVAVPGALDVALPSVDPVWLTAGLVVFALLWLAVAVLDAVRGGLDHKKIIAPIDIVLLPYVLVLIEPDLGTATICLAIAGSMILFCGVRLRDFLIAATAMVGVAVLAWNFVLHDYQRQRVETFLNPEADIKGAGYHAAQSIIAVGSGQATGKGYGEGTQTQLSFLPENHTDFVFSVLGEEWGFVGGALLIGLLFALVALMLRGARKATDRFSALVAVGAAAMIFWHAFINIGMVIGVLPVVGVTLPLVSYGGSSMITKIAAVGLAINAHLGRRGSS